MTIEVTEEAKEAIGVVLDLAYYDQDTYLQSGSFATDYGDEWREVCWAKQTHFRAIAELSAQLGLAGESGRWDELAIRFGLTLMHLPANLPEASSDQNCSACGEPLEQAEEVVGCPDGSEIHRRCFDQGAN